MVVFDPLDGSSNIDAGISTGSIFGIYAPSEECSIDDMENPEKMMQVTYALTHTVLSHFMNAHACRDLKDMHKV